MQSDEGVGAPPGGVSGASVVGRRERRRGRLERTRNMMPNRRKPRRVDAVAAQRQQVFAALKRTMIIMLPIWLAYFFAVSLFARNLNAVTVPVVELPLGTSLVIQGSALVFTITLYLLTRAFAAISRS
jgi:putative solute:sodium symporter small subunit